MLRLILITSMLACGGGSGNDDAGAGDSGARDTGVDVLLDAEPDLDGGDDAGPDAASDAGADTGDDAGADAGDDAGTDAASDAGTDSGMCELCVEQSLGWELDGGLRAFESSNAVASCRTHTYTRTTFPGGEMSSCSSEVPCEEDAVTMAELLTALEHADVVAGFAAAPIRYGRDGRPFDAPLFVITYGADVVQLGLSCAGMVGCTEVPAGWVALRNLLVELEGERLAAEPCASTFP